MLSRQPTIQGHHRIGHRRCVVSLRQHLLSGRTKAAERYGTRLVLASRPGSEDVGPTLSRSGSESESEAESTLPLLEAEVQSEGNGKGVGPLAGLGSIGGIVLLLGAGVLLKDVIREFLVFFIDAVDSWGPLGYLAYAAVYTGLEVLAVPAIPLTMTAGVIFGPIPGTIVTSVSGTAAATVAFLIARYAARDRVLGWARKNTKFAAIDRAIAKNGFKFVTLLRLSPLFPLAASNYLYGLTSVDLWSYVAGSWIGMLPGTYAYVSAGHLGKAALLDGEGSIGVESWQVGLGLGVTLLAVGYVGRLAKTAIEEADQQSDIEEDEEEERVRSGNGSSSSSSSGVSSSDSSNGSNGVGDSSNAAYYSSNGGHSFIGNGNGNGHSAKGTNGNGTGGGGNTDRSGVSGAPLVQARREGL